MVPIRQPARFRRARIRRCAAAVALPLVLALAAGVPTAAAKSHLWRFTEVFSTADGSIQFIEMFVFNPAGTGETQFAGRPLTSNTNTYLFPSNLADENTAQRWVLIATQSFADLPGAPTPDYILPANFFDPIGDQLRYRATIDQITIAPGALPLDGVRSLMRDGAGLLSTGLNNPTNFAGETHRVFAGGAVFVDGFE